MDEQVNQEEAPATKPAPPRLLGDRYEAVPLEYPVDYDGKVWTEITVRRMAADEVAAYIDAILKDPEEARLPMFDAPPEVMDALDPDDQDEIAEVVERFLPRRLRRVAGQTPENGASTSPSSEAS